MTSKLPTETMHLDLDKLKLTAPYRTFSNLSIWNLLCGSHMTHAYFNIGRTMVKYAVIFASVDASFDFLLKNRWPNIQSFSFVSGLFHWPAPFAIDMSSVKICTNFLLRKILALEFLWKRAHIFFSAFLLKLLMAIFRLELSDIITPKHLTCCTHVSLCTFIS